MLSRGKYIVSLLQKNNTNDTSDYNLCGPSASVVCVGRVNNEEVVTHNNDYILTELSPMKVNNRPAMPSNENHDANIQETESHLPREENTEGNESVQDQFNKEITVNIVNCGEGNSRDVVINGVEEHGEEENDNGKERSAQFDSEINLTNASNVDIQLTKKGNPRKRKQNLMSKEEKTAAGFENFINKHPLRPPCDKCRLQCTAHISEARRKVINEMYNKKNWVDRRNFLLISSTRQGVKRRRGSEDSKRMFSFKYYLTDEKEEQVHVCKTFFLTTLGYSKNNDTVLHNVLCVENPTDILPDGRGKSTPPTKVDRNVLKAHIESYNPCIAHYRRCHAPNRRYLPSDITVTDMHKNFVSTHPEIKCSYDLYRSVVKEMNISFTKLGNEECDTCEVFSKHNADHSKDNLVAECEQCTKWADHIEKSNEARTLYKQHAEATPCENKIYCSVDLQKVIMLPRLEGFKSAVFTKRIIAFNESFVPLGSKQKTLKPFAVIWHEAIAGRKKEDIVSAFNAFFLQCRDVHHIVLWLDNCSGQNKNWCLLSYLVNIVNSESVSTNIVELYFFEPGHTFMSADSFHHQVEQSLNRLGKVYDFSDFEKSVANANSGKTIVKSMRYDNFAQWPSCVSFHKLKKCQSRPLLSDIVYIKAEAEKNTLEYKTCYDELCPTQELDFMTKNGIATALKPPTFKTCARGICLEKKDDILQKLVPLMPESRRQFWRDLPVNNVPDLCVFEDN